MHRRRNDASWFYWLVMVPWHLGQGTTSHGIITDKYTGYFICHDISHGEIWICWFTNLDINAPWWHTICMIPEHIWTGHTCIGYKLSLSRKVVCAPHIPSIFCSTFLHKFMYILSFNKMGYYTTCYMLDTHLKNTVDVEVECEMFHWCITILLLGYNDPILYQVICCTVLHV